MVDQFSQYFFTDKEGKDSSNTHHDNSLSEKDETLEMNGNDNVSEKNSTIEENHHPNGLNFDNEKESIDLLNNEEDEENEEDENKGEEESENESESEYEEVLVCETCNLEEDKCECEEDTDDSAEDESVCDKCNKDQCECVSNVTLQQSFNKDEEDEESEYEIEEEYIYEEIPASPPRYRPFQYQFQEAKSVIISDEIQALESIRKLQGERRELTRKIHFYQQKINKLIQELQSSNSIYQAFLIKTNKIDDEIESILGKMRVG